MRQQRARGGQTRLEPPLTLLGERPVSGEVAVLDRLLDVGELVAGDEHFVERYSNAHIGRRATASSEPPAGSERPDRMAACSTLLRKPNTPLIAGPMRSSAT